MVASPRASIQNRSCHSSPPLLPARSAEGHDIVAGIAHRNNRLVSGVEGCGQDEQGIGLVLPRQLVCDCVSNAGDVLADHGHDLRLTEFKCHFPGDTFSWRLMSL